MKKTSLFLVVVLAAMVSLHAQESGTTPEGLQWRATGMNIAITGYTGTATTVVIPSRVDNTARSVLTIGEGAFEGKTTLTSVTLPNTITSIEAGAFNNCTRLSTINWPTSLSTIGDYAFCDCRSLGDSITFPAMLRTIGASAFRGMSLKNVTIPASVTSIGNEAFRGSGEIRVTMSRSTRVGTNAFSSTATFTYR